MIDDRRKERNSTVPMALTAFAGSLLALAILCYMYVAINKHWIGM